MHGFPCMARLSLLWPLLFALCVASAVAHDNTRFMALNLRAENSSSSSVPSSTSASQSSFSSSSFSSSAASRSSSASATSTSTSAPSSSSSSTTSSSSSTSVITTATSSSSSFSSSFSPSSTVALASKTAALVVTPSATVKPTSTLDVPPDIVTTAPSSSASASTHVDAASTGFWQNKGAVAGTFVVVALFIIGILGAVGIVLRRRAASRNVARDTFFDTKGPIEHERAHSPGPSMASLGNQPLDAHTTPGPNYGAADHYLVDTTDYNVSYPPGAAYAPAADYGQAPADTYGHAVTADYGHADYTHAAEQHYPAAQYDTQDAEPYDANAYESYTQYYSDPAPASGTGYSVAPANQRPSLSPHPYSHPSHAPSAMRDLVGRDSAYQQSIDSFYGVGAAGGTAV